MAGFLRVVNPAPREGELADWHPQTAEPCPGDKAASRWSVSRRESQVSTPVWNRHWSEPKWGWAGSTGEAGISRTLATHNQRPKPKASRRRQGGESHAWITGMDSQSLLL